MLNVLNMPEIKFPEKFVWGTATAAHQIEGNDKASFNTYLEKKYDYPELSGNACNSWLLYEYDIKLMQDLHHQAYRMSISWARIEPEEGRFDQAAVKRYIEILSALKNAGITTFVTLMHGSLPTWFGKKNRFLKEDNISHFEQYIQYIVPLIDDYVDYYNVLNEFNITCPRADFRDNMKYRMNCAIAHARGYHIIKSISKSPVSTAHALQNCKPANPYDKFDVQAADMFDWQENEFFFHAIKTGELVMPYSDAIDVPELKDSLDFWSINYYCRKMISARKKNFIADWNPVSRYKMIEQDFYMEDFNPEGLTNGLSRLSNLPVYITENGCCCADDRWRILKLALDLWAMNTAIDNGVDVRGYMHWSLFDNYEWTSFKPKFGLVDVDFETFKRTPKPSAFFLRDIIDNSMLSGALVKKHLPELPEFKLF